MFWSFQKMLLPLHSQFENEGSVAQLNRASDYGSEGYRFESCRSHKTLKTSKVHFGSFFLCFVITNPWWERMGKANPVGVTKKISGNESLLLVSIFFV